MDTCIILGAQNDYHAYHMLTACNKHGLDALLFDTSRYPSQVNIDWDPNCYSGNLEVDGRALAFEQIRSVFWSTIASVRCEPCPPNQQGIAQHDAMSMLRTFLEQQQIDWVNSWEVFQAHKVKPLQLSLARRCGAQVPETYIGNHPDALLQFVDAHPDSIFKPVYGGAHACPIDTSMLDRERLQQVLAVAPVTIQEYVSGTNIRSYVIAEQVYAAEIRSRFTDFRNDEDAKHHKLTLPPTIQKLAVEINRQFGMRWTAIDWRRTEDGHYYFLEANPSPMFIHFEQLTGYPITEQLTRLLAGEH